ncbi:MAG: DNA-3-methyladenine glycosylase 2 family protein [Actinomycetota bacterium]
MPLDVTTATKHIAGADPAMRAIIKQIGPCELKPGARGDHFTTLLRAIVGQQLSAKAAETIFQRVAALHRNGRKIAPEDILKLSDAELRACGLSNAKTAYVKDLARHVESGAVQLNRFGRKSDDQIIAELTAIKGIGRWTAEMFLMFKLGRPDVWAIDDLGLRNAVKRSYGISRPARWRAVRLR